MPRFVYKEAPDVDYYCVWSTVVDGPVFTGNREETLALLRRESDEWLMVDAPHHPEQRLKRADETGTSSLWVTKENRENPSFAAHGHIEQGCWADDTYIFEQQGVLTRAALFEACHRMDAATVAGDEADISDLLQPLEGRDDVVRVDL